MGRPAPDATPCPPGWTEAALELDSSQHWAQREDLALLTDFYQLTMMNGYWKSRRHELPVCFEYFFRELPPHTGFAIACGLEQFLSFYSRLRFSPQDLDYLATLPHFSPGFLDYLAEFRPSCTIHAVPEGTPVFPHEPIVRVEGPLGEAQLLETVVLNSFNYPTLIATKTARIRLAAEGDVVMEFGMRRAQGPDGGLSGTRAAYVGGADSTSNVLAGKLYGIPVGGTHAHSWVMSFPDELSAFRAYATIYPRSPLLLVDTYDTLTSGLPNALRVFQESREAGNPVRAAIRLDSGDLARLSKAAYQMFTEAGFKDPLIVGSNELDEDLIADLKRQGARINAWGVGTHLITSSSWPALGGIYKLVAVGGAGGAWEPRIKLSSNLAKMTDPGRKSLVRYQDTAGHPIGDVLYNAEETPQDGPTVTYVQRENPTFRRELLNAASWQPLLQLVAEEGRVLGPSPALATVRSRAQTQVAALPEELRRLRNPQIYEVGLSPRLGRSKVRLMHQEADAAPGRRVRLTAVPQPLTDGAEE